jgi:tRNA A-37 threonylcarbamoyl transferase component Bud32
VVEGTQVGAYRVLRKIGEGGMGSVWLAEHAMLGRRAAIKVLHSEYSNHAETVTRFFNEARAATAVGDPGIVQIFDFGQRSDGSAYIVMELLDGEPLDRRLARHGALGLPDALRIMRQVASTLGAAHACGIVHRDLKPENVFIVRDPEVAGGERAKILDFGIAKLVGDHGGVKTRTQAVMGTPRYMSPEQCRGAGGIDQRSDVYALGCVLFRLLIGRPPFDAEGVGELIAMHLREPPPVPSSLRAGISPEVDQLVLRCLAKDPAQRFGHGGELAIALGSLLGWSPQLGAFRPSAAYAAVSLPTTLSSSTGASTAATPARPRHGAVFTGLGVVAVAGVVAIGLTRGDSDEASPEPGSARAPAPAVSGAPSPAVSAESPPSPAPRAPDPNAEVAAPAKDVMTRFVAWSRDHQGAPCPDIAALSDPPRDPWGHAFRLTCTDQPGDQIIGAISAGPDGTPGTTDDIASWQLGRDVTDSVRGARWVAAALPPSTPARSERGPNPATRREPAPPGTRPVQSKPAAGAKTKQDKFFKVMELDENGLPISH